MASQSITKLENKTKQRKTLTLHLNTVNTVKRKRTNPYDDQIWRFDWDGFEQEREEVHNLAVQIQEATAELDSECKTNGWQCCGAVGCAVRDPEEAERIFSPYVVIE